MTGKFYFFAHQNKERALVDALLQAGWTETGAKEADVIFADNDYGVIRAQLAGYYAHGKKIMIYPHGGRVSLFNDLPDSKPTPYIACQFVTAEGHKEVLQSFGYPHPVEVIGWYLCPLKPFEPKEQIRNVLFAPIHPDADGTLSDVDKQVNRLAFDKLLPLHRQGVIKLTVRFLRSLKENGLPPPVNGVIYIQGKPDQSIKEIDAADLVVSSQTFQYLAVARGASVIGMGENIAPHLGDKVVQSWDKYKHLMMYPIDILDDFHSIGASDVSVANWRDRMVGEAFDGGKFVEMVEKYA